jgi:hypothetical protein
MQGEKGRYATQEHLLGGIKKIGTTAMSHCWELRTLSKENQSYLTKQSTQKIMKKYSYTSISDVCELLGLIGEEAFGRDQMKSGFPKKTASSPNIRIFLYTYEQLEIRVNRCAKSILWLTSKGDRVGICASNCM